MTTEAQGEMGVLAARYMLTLLTVNVLSCCRRCVGILDDPGNDWFCSSCLAKKDKDSKDKAKKKKKKKSKEKGK